MKKLGIIHFAQRHNGHKIEQIVICHKIGIIQKLHAYTVVQVTLPKITDIYRISMYLSVLSITLFIYYTLIVWT